MGFGYIKLDRKILESEIWREKPFDRARAWVDLLLLANWKDQDEIYRGRLEHRKRGDVNCSIQWLADRWGWSRNKVYRYLALLTDTGMCTVDGTPNGTTLHIEKYAFYQDGQNTNGTTNETTNGTTDGTTDGTHKKKGKESIKNPKNARAREGEGNPYLKLLQNMEEEQ